MPDISTDALARVNNLPKLVELLRDHLDWPIEEDDFDDIVFEYEPQELGLKEEEAAKLREIHQLRPLVTNQPWGVFFISFEEKQLSVTVLRRILRALVVKQRGNAAHQKAWDKGDLIFAANFGRSGERELAFVHFSDGEATNDLPVMKVLGWNAKDTKLHNEYAAQMLSKQLAWPYDDSDDKAWRKQWSGAFEIGHRQVIKTSRDLALHLAGLATQIRARANELLEAEADDGPMQTMLEAFRKNLIHDLDEDGFADMFAQTICYGMLAAAISRPSGALVADNMADMVPRTNPFLKELFANFLKLGGRDKRSNLDFDELGVREVVDMLQGADMPAVLRDFGDRNPKEDPVIHFYELFLKEYDPAKRMQRGVFYTPRPVVNFIVRGVDEVLRTEFDLPLGLADTTTWSELATRNDKITVPDHIDPNQPFVQILDPATGTGTFLVEVIDLIHKRMVEHWQTEGKSKAEMAEAWNEYVPVHLLPRLTGFELMMAPYAIAHMKLGLKLTETGYKFGSEERAHIFLTNALEPPKEIEAEFTFIAEALAAESREASLHKREKPVSVVIGNPPYANYSANLDPVSRALVDVYRNFRGQPIRERNQLQFERNIQDDYVKFLAVGQRYIAESGYGVLSFITNGTVLSSKSLRGLRERVWENFNRIYEINLHGGTNERFRGHRADENVFEISQAVAIHLYEKSSLNDPEAVAYVDLVGGRENKYNFLIDRRVSDIPWEEISPSGDNMSFSISETEDVNTDFRLPDVFRKFGAGIKTNRDAVVIGFDRATLIEQVSDHDPQLENELAGGQAIQDMQYRPFDWRKIFYHADLVKSRSWPTMQHMLAGENIGIIGSSTWTSPERFSAGISESLVEMKTGTHDRGTSFFPLYRYEGILAEEVVQRSNFSERFKNLWESVTATELLEVGNGDLNDQSGPNDVLNWLYFLFYSPVYRQRLAGPLSEGFPIILLPNSRDLLINACQLGRRLVALHLLKPEEEPILKSPDVRFAGTGEARVEKGFPDYENGKVRINANRWFEDVPKETWEFHVGGYQVCDKWLKDRAGKGGQNPRPGRVLTEEDILHYRRVVTALTETSTIMAEIDKAIEKHGGWPGAFAIGTDAEEGE